LKRFRAESLAADLIFTLGGLPKSRFRRATLPKIAHLAIDAGRSRKFFSIGRPAYSNNITIDGLDNNDDRARARAVHSLRPKPSKKFR
jgi:hypothetical protein